ncbi:MAG: hydantoinase/oxoprolinase family protein [Vicinamibacterales bacterium]|jgi:N-methylhydantoinase A|nr:5-oxoprolinase [Acidobacteriota bacterium]MDP6371186.1 hydantoinase/oxoprolinase family protein [Vicinamibacterales bacterium]MDP6608265.1 hydantoinase/oxoprolinase family protein [Vicinamibacterales bacterium]HAK54182.1 5-oxoprolinase [Acidobacteriota bacterium]|tara:strand:+ start:26349 stop:28439 length:2091 start_codon:yes stop_codon:yes gene_type:complete
MPDRFKIGIDVGGTFTDLFLHSSSNEVATFKVLSTPDNPSIGVLHGLERIAQSLELEVGALAARVDTIVHGTTVTTNATLTRSGARVGLLTTHGVRDALEMRRGVREEQYDNRYRNVIPIVPRRLRLPVRGRLDYRGVEIEALDLDGVRRACGSLRTAEVEAVAICFMNAFANAAHEDAAAAIVRTELPDAYVSVSSEVLPSIRFYNRLSTTVLNAYVGPVLLAYLTSLQRRLADAGFGGVLLIMQSSGGVGHPAAILERPATTLLSGPAAGPNAALSVTEPLSQRSTVVVDMGGTSFDASLVRDGAVALKAEGDLDRLRIALPMLEITTIGAGGGSIGRLDAGGLLRMGPQSAGAVPGPACYDRGGERPTCTDADLTLGYLDPTFFAGGQITLRPDLARTAIATHVATPMGLDVEAAAAGMYRVINANMAHGVREITIKRGLDPREFPMVVAGGAGALHACMIAQELDIPTIMVPSPASVLCAVGMLMSDLQHDYVRSYVTALSDLEPDRLQAVVGDLTALGDAELAREGVPEARRQHGVLLDLRYAKQYHEVTVPVAPAAIANGDLEAIGSAFHREHNRLYGYDLEAEGTGLTLITVRVRSVGRTDKPRYPKLRSGGNASDSLKGHRRAYVPETERFDEVPVYDGHALRAAHEIAGPALIERVDTTLFVSAAFTTRVDDHGTLVLEPAGRGSSP